MTCFVQQISSLVLIAIIHHRSPHHVSHCCFCKALHSCLYSVVCMNPFRPPCHLVMRQLKNTLINRHCLHVVNVVNAKCIIGTCSCNYLWASVHRNRSVIGIKQQSLSYHFFSILECIQRMKEGIILDLHITKRKWRMPEYCM